jgi:uncharacterized LabA/DUF88 family protein
MCSSQADALRAVHVTKQAAARRLCPFQHPMKTIVYVDGLNLYYAALRGTPYKWLDLYALFRDKVLEAGTEVEQIRYYTVPVKGSSSDDPCSPQRQQRYLRALKAYRGSQVEIIQGFIARSTPFLRLVGAKECRAIPTKVRVYHFAEKQTDVNLAADLVSDSWRQRCGQAVICSNDSDLVGALASVRRDHPQVALGLVPPVREPCHISRELKDLATWCKTLEKADLAEAQLPERIPGTQLSRPLRWAETLTPVEPLREPARRPPSAA